MCQFSQEEQCVISFGIRFLRKPNSFPQRQLHVSKVGQKNEPNSVRFVEKHLKLTEPEPGEGVMPATWRETDFSFRRSSAHSVISLLYLLDNNFIRPKRESCLSSKGIKTHRPVFRWREIILLFS